MVCFMGFQELSPSVMQNVLQETTSPTFSLFMMFMIILEQWECGSHQHNTNIGGNGEEKEDVYIRDYRILAVTAKDKELMRKGQSGSESTARVYNNHHHPHSSIHSRWTGSPKSAGLTDQDYTIKPLMSYITENPSALQDFACCTHT
jgi:hypothetical protein